MSTTTAKPDPWVAWQEAERTIGTPAFEQAVRARPPRQAVLLRALGALDEGTPSALRAAAAAARAAGFPEVAAILDVALTPADQIDPSKLRQAAKRSGLGAGLQLPFLDLLRAQAVATSGSPANVAAALRDHARFRPLLDAIVMVFSSQAMHSYRWPALKRSHPRAEQTFNAAMFAARFSRAPSSQHALLHDGHDHIGLHRACWTAESDTPDKRLRVVLRSDTELLAPHGHEAEWLYVRPAAERQRWLRELLVALQRRASRGKLRDLGYLAHIAAHLAHDLRMTPLAVQLVTLEAQLDWAERSPSDGPTDAALTLLWGVRDRLAPSALTELAEQIYFYDLGESHVLGTVLCLLAVDPQLHRLRGLYHHLRAVVTPATLRSHITRYQPTPAREQLLVGVLHALTGAHAQLLTAAQALAAGGHHAELCELVLQLLPSDHGQVSGGQRRTCAQLQPLLLVQPATANSMQALGHLVQAVGSAPPEVHAYVEARAQEQAPELIGATLGLLHLLHRDDRARELLREAGRPLRKPATPAAGVELALRLVAGALLMPSSAVPTLMPLLVPLTQFLHGAGLPAVLTAARALPRDPTIDEALSDWYLSTVDGPPSSDWLAWLCARLDRRELIVPPSSELDDELSRYVLLSAPECSSLRELVDDVGRQLDEPYHD